VPVGRNARHRCERRPVRSSRGPQTTTSQACVRRSGHSEAAGPRRPGPLSRRSGRRGGSRGLPTGYPTKPSGLETAKTYKPYGPQQPVEADGRRRVRVTEGGKRCATIAEQPSRPRAHRAEWREVWGPHAGRIKPWLSRRAVRQPHHHRHPGGEVASASRGPWSPGNAKEAGTSGGEGAFATAGELGPDHRRQAVSSTITRKTGTRRAYLTATWAVELESCRPGTGRQIPG